MLVKTTAMNQSKFTLAFDQQPYQLSGTVYGTLLNHRPAIEALVDQMDAAPYKGAPKAPVLYVKPRNTLSQHGDPVVVPHDAPQLQVAAALGMVIGRTASRLTLDNALEHLAGYTIVNDVSVPHDSFYRPSIRFKARDGFCPMGPGVTSRQAIAQPDQLQVRVYVDDVLQHDTTTGDRVRNAAQLLVDVTEFMTLRPGDVLMLGASAGAPLVGAGQTVAIEIEGLGRLVNHFVSAA